MKETGQIISIHEGFAEIKMNAKGSCPSCSASGMCHVSGTANRQIRLPLNGLSVSNGDFVEIETPARSLLSAAFLIFIFPLLFSALAYYMTIRWTQSQEWALLGFFGCFIISEILVMLLDRWFGRRAFFEPKIIKRIDN